MTALYLAVMFVAAYRLANSPEGPAKFVGFSPSLADQFAAVALWVAVVHANNWGPAVLDAAASLVHPYATPIGGFF